MVEKSSVKAGFVIDASGWPVVVVDGPPGSVSNEVLADFIERWSRMLLERGESYAAVIDLREGRGNITPLQRRQITDSISGGRHHSLCLGFAMVFDSVVLRSILTAILWVKRPPYDIKVFNELEEAKTWARAQVKAHRSTGT